MCIGITKKNTVCRLSPSKEYCWRHQPKPEPQPATPTEIFEIMGEKLPGILALKIALHSPGALCADLCVSLGIKVPPKKLVTSRLQGIIGHLHEMNKLMREWRIRHPDKMMALRYMYQDKLWTTLQDVPTQYYCDLITRPVILSQ